MRAVPRALAALLAGFCLLAVSCGGSSTPSPTPTPRLPDLLCPASFSITGTTGAPEAVAYPPPVLASGTTPVTITCTPVSGSTFQPGATPVTCRVVDSFNQADQCSFVVTLRARTLNAMTFLAFGDSVTAGENSLPLPSGGHGLFVDVANAYPTKLESMLQMDFPGQMATVINEGLPGERATVGVDRLEDLLPVVQPEAVLLLDGYNDLIGDGIAAVDPVARAMRDMVREAKSAGVAYVLVSTITPGRAGSRMIPPSAILQTNALIRQMALAEGAILVDNFNTFVGREATLVSDDGLHLTAAGNQVLADTFLAAIKTAVASGDRGIGRSVDR